MNCAMCGKPATRSLLAVDYCTACAEAILEPIRQHVITDEGGIGWGQQHGPTRPDWGPRYADLHCTKCDATWTGPIGEPCSWCTDSIDRMRQWQAEIVLTPPDTDPDDIRHPAAMAGWKQRLDVAIDAELITRHQAGHAWRRATVTTPPTT